MSLYPGSLIRSFSDSLFWPIKLNSYEGTDLPIKGLWFSFEPPINNQNKNNDKSSVKNNNGKNLFIIPIYLKKSCYIRHKFLKDLLIYIKLINHIFNLSKLTW